MRKLILILFSSILIGQIPLKYNENITPTYDEAISWYQILAIHFPIFGSYICLVSITNQPDYKITHLLAKAKSYSGGRLTLTIPHLSYPTL